MSNSFGASIATTSTSTTNNNNNSMIQRAIDALPVVRRALADCFLGGIVSIAIALPHITSSSTSPSTTSTSPNANTSTNSNRTHATTASSSSATIAASSSSMSVGSGRRMNLPVLTSSVVPPKSTSISTIVMRRGSSKELARNNKDEAHRRAQVWCFCKTHENRKMITKMCMCM